MTKSSAPRKSPGRPKIEPNERQSVRIQVLVTPDEMEIIQRHVEKSGETISTFCRSALLKSLSRKDAK
jgi:hypothetical protein